MAKKQTTTVRKLDSRLDGDFVMVGIQPGEIRFKGTKYDTRIMDPQTAEHLVEAGASFIRKKKRRTPKG